MILLALALAGAPAALPARPVRLAAAVPARRAARLDALARTVRLLPAETPRPVTSDARGPTGM
jgi:hypothetical protein